MKRIPDRYWLKLEQEFDGKLLAALRRQLDSTDSVFPTVERLCAGLANPTEDARALLDRLVADGYLNASEHRLCQNCGGELDEEAVENQRCHCGQSFEDGAIPEIQRTYERPGLPSRDVGWVVTVHGMNTPGGWQQDFSWRMAKLYGYAVPVAIYKYGNIKLSPFIPYRQNRHRDRLLRKLRALRDEMIREGYGERPDVIAHSFGTWLLVQAMLADNHDDKIKLGRVILTGSIVRPDFDWGTLLGDRIEAVMCHYGGRDVPVRIAQYFIPNSGPSGQKGFNDQNRIIHKFEKRYRHSDYFTEANLNTVMEEKWAPFLTLPLSELEGDTPNRLAENPWSASRWRFLTHTAKAATFAILILIIILIAGAIAAGLFPFLEWTTIVAKSFGIPRLDYTAIVSN